VLPSAKRDGAVLSAVTSVVCVMRPDLFLMHSHPPGGERSGNNGEGARSAVALTNCFNWGSIDEGASGMVFGPRSHRHRSMWFSVRATASSVTPRASASKDRPCIHKVATKRPTATIASTKTKIPTLWR
jgi:hypothetical protein